MYTQEMDPQPLTVRATPHFLALTVRVAPEVYIEQQEQPTGKSPSSSKSSSRHTPLHKAANPFAFDRCEEEELEHKHTPKAHRT